VDYSINKKKFDGSCLDGAAVWKHLD